MTEKIKVFFAELSATKGITVKQLSLTEGPAGAADLRYIEDRKTVSSTFLDFYKEMNGMTVDWVLNHDEETSGKVRILPFSEVIVNWNGIVYFDDTLETDPIRRFFPIDFFADEACAGIYATPEQKANIYYYTFEGEPMDLQLDMYGYCEMMIEARGFRYWQLVLKEIITGKENLNSQHFKEQMPEIFTGFSFARFQEKFNSLKIK